MLNKILIDRYSEFLKSIDVEINGNRPWDITVHNPDLYKSILDEEANATLNRAWDLGVRYYDTAPLYGLGLSETRLNKFLRSKNENDYILSSKVTLDFCLLLFLEIF